MTSLVATPFIRETIQQTLSKQSLDQKKREKFQEYLDQEAIPVATLKELAKASSVYFHELLVGTKIYVPPKEVKPIDPAREAHKAKLRKAAQDRDYFRMVKDITVENPLGVQKDRVEMQTALKDAAIPLNLVLTSVGAFAFGYYFVYWSTGQFLKAMATGMGFAIIIFLVEVILFIMRQQKEQRQYETHEKEELLPFGVPGSRIHTKKKID
eukprot:TRINITY_DN1416_c0_g1_i1.p1 TRINITY_DN1416_c0_g1~~TRINITY_DN1416_c0_g1_i1.p1  ORF type:complete len:211 (+),score=44.12 TRINITY_DN1416_c0_g1_i1:3-635(+)